MFADLHRAHGVDFRFGAGRRSSPAATGRLTGVRARRRHRLPRRRRRRRRRHPPNTELAERGRPRRRQRHPGRRARCAPPTPTSSPPATWPTSTTRCCGRRIRVEHWANALNGGPAAARSMLGQDVRYDRLPYFFTDQYDLGMEYSGYVAPGGYDRGGVPRRPRRRREFIAFWASGRPGAGRDERQRLGRHRRHPGAGPRRLRGATVDPAALADPDTPRWRISPAERDPNR